MTNVTQASQPEDETLSGQQGEVSLRAAAEPTDVFRKLHQESDKEIEREVTPQPGEVVPGAASPPLTKTHRWVGSSFADRESAERAYQMFLQRGYERREINLVMSKETREKYFSDEGARTELDSKAHEGTAEDIMKGAGQGTLIGALLAAGSNILLPGFGLFVGGPLFIGLGAITGGLRRALAKSGLPEDEAEKYEVDLREGRIVLGVVPHTEEDAQYFEREWKKF